MNYKYITTPIYYPNGNPHLGHAYTTIVGDAYKKFYQTLEYKVLYTSGCDEHGLKIQRAALKEGITPQELVDTVSQSFKNCWEELGLDIDYFVRTTNPLHKAYVQKVWEQLVANGYIYFGQYTGLYCVGCEQYYKESELIDGIICPIHNTVCENISEDSYFFRLSAFRDRLIATIKSGQFLVEPENRTNEVLSFLEGNELQDLSISRNTFSWGIPIPGSEDHVMYVWLDALFNYVSSLGGDTTEEFKNYWPHTIHLLGKDILRFHAVYWPAFLVALNLPLPNKLVVHGWWKISNRKISKSDPATKVDPLVLAKHLTRDGLRYILLKDGVFDRDGNLDYQRAFEVINADLANNLGNLVNRVSKLIIKFFGGTLPAVALSNADGKERSIIDKFHELSHTYVQEFEKNIPSVSLNSVIEMCHILNLYINNEKPWQKFKDPAKEKEVALNLAVCIEGIRWITNLGYPFFPDISIKINRNIFQQNDFILPKEFLLLPKTIHKDEIIFERLGDETLSTLIENLLI